MFCYAVKKSGKSLVTWQKYFNTKKDYDHLYESCTMLREASVHVDFAAKLYPDRENFDAVMACDGRRYSFGNIAHNIYSSVESERSSLFG